MEDTDFAKIGDNELVELSLKDNDNFYYLLHRYEKKLFYYIKRLLNIDDHLAEDVLQEVFLKVYLNLNDFNPDYKFSSWIYRIAHNESISHYRKTKNQSKDINIDDPKYIDLLKETKCFREEYEKKELGRDVSQVIETLPEKYKDVIILRFLEEKDYEEISDILKIPEGTVATLLNRGKKIFKERAKELIDLT